MTSTDSDADLRLPLPSSSHYKHHALLTDVDDYDGDNDHDDDITTATTTHPFLRQARNAAPPSSIHNPRHNFYARPLSIGHFVWGGTQQDPRITSSSIAPKVPDSAVAPVKTSQQTAVLAPSPSFWTGYTKSKTTDQKISNMATATEDAHESAAAAGVERTPAPGSPPELSYSKSSKSDSSSYRSSLSDDGAETEKLSHFEDITLEGRSSPESMEEVTSVNGDSNVKPENRPTLKRPPPPRSLNTMEQMRDNFPIRQARNGGRGGYPPARSFSNGGATREQNLGLPNGRGLRRQFSSPSSPSFPLNAMQRSPSRSPSPRQRHVQSPGSIGSTTPRASVDGRNSNALSRRSSWQPGRKTVKELEAECDDLDDEVPEEAVLENVPVTPMPGMMPSQSRSQSRSHTPSPSHRESFPTNILPPLHNNLHSANVPKHAKRPHASTNRVNTSFGPPRSPKGRQRPGMMPHSATTSGFPRDLGPGHRSKSWAADLSDEARQLSAALDEYHERKSSEKRESRANSVPSSPPRPSFSAKNRSTTGLMDSPQKQKGNPMIDPLPISKEKEAVLTRTRPSWLPPKSQKEEKKHMREWEKMMAQATAAEKKRSLKQQEETETRSELQDSSARIWEQHVLPQWDTVIREPRTRELWWRGVTPASRGLVWEKAIGNELGLSATSYEAALKRAQALETQIASMHPDERKASKEAAWFGAIARDVATLPAPASFYELADFQQALASVLKAYALYRSDVGYVYGTHLIAAALLTYLPSAPAAFVTLANALNRPLPLAFLVHDTAAMARTYDLVLQTLQYKFPTLHAHLASPATDLKAEEFLDPMFRTLLSKNLGTESVARVWDVWAFEGDKVLIRAAVAVLGCLEGRLYGSREEILDLVSWRHERVWDVGGEEAFVKAVRDAGKVEGGRKGS